MNGTGNGFIESLGCLYLAVYFRFGEDNFSLRGCGIIIVRREFLKEGIRTKSLPENGRPYTTLPKTLGLKPIWR